MGGRLGASPAPHGSLLEGQTHRGLGKNLQPHGPVAGKPGNSLVSEPPSLSLLPPGVTCKASSARDPAALATAAPPPPQAGHPELAGVSLGSRQSWHWLQPLSPASSLKLMQRFLFGAGDARGPPPPLFCRDHRSICCPMVGPLGSATREQHHKGPCWQLCLRGVRLQQVEGGRWSEAGPGGRWGRSRRLDLVHGQLEPSASSSTWNMEMIIFRGR